MSKPTRSPVEGRVGEVSATDQARSIASQDKAQGTLNQFEGPVQDSPFYKALKTAGTESTANAYANAKSNTMARAKAAGFGYEQPVAAGAGDEVGAREAADQARVPGEALLKASGPALSAAGTTAGIGATQSGAGLGYSGQQVDLEKQYQEQLAAQQQAMWSALAQAGGAAASFCVAEDTPICVSHTKSVQASQLRVGDAVLGIEGQPLKIVNPTVATNSPVLVVVTASGLKLLCSPSHTMLRPGGGYVRAKDALYEQVLTVEGPSAVVQVADQGTMRVVHFELNGSHTFCTGGIWSEE